MKIQVKHTIMKTENNQNQGKEQEEVLNEPMAETQELNTPGNQ